MNTPLSHKKRKGLDSELGKVVLSTDLGIMDSMTHHLPQKIVSHLDKIHPGLSKFLFASDASRKVHLKSFAKRYDLGNY